MRATSTTSRTAPRPTDPSATRKRERAQADYQRFKEAYDRLCAEEPDNDVGRMLIGMDLERAMRVLEELDEE